MAPAHMVLWIWLAMFGNGWLTGMMMSITVVHHWKIQQDRKLENISQCGVAHGNLVNEMFEQLSSIGIFHHFLGTSLCRTIMMDFVVLLRHNSIGVF